MITIVAAQIAKILKNEIGMEVEITFRGIENDKQSFTISGYQYSALAAMLFMTQRGIATLTYGVSDIEDRDFAFYYMVQA